MDTGDAISRRTKEKSRRGTVKGITRNEFSAHTYVDVMNRWHYILTLKMLSIIDVPSCWRFPRTASSSCGQRRKRRLYWTSFIFIAGWFFGSLLKKIWERNEIQLFKVKWINIVGFGIIKLNSTGQFAFGGWSHVCWIRNFYKVKYLSPQLRFLWTTDFLKKDINLIKWRQTWTPWVHVVYTLSLIPSKKG